MLFTKSTLNTINYASKRFIRKKVIMKSWPNDWVPFLWKRPEKSPGYFDSADLVKFGQPPKEKLLFQVRNSKQLNELDTDDPVRKIFSLDHGRRSMHNKSEVFDFIQKLGVVHEVDYKNSLEAQIINNTFALRHVREVIENKDAKSERYIGHLKTLCNSIKYRRYRMLCELKELHADRWARLTELLNLEPEINKINVKHYRPYRKVQMRLLAQQYASDLKEKKVEDYMKKLEGEKIEFEKEKLETLKWIEEQEKQLGLTVS